MHFEAKEGRRLPQQVLERIGGRAGERSLRAEEGQALDGAVAGTEAVADTEPEQTEQRGDQLRARDGRAGEVLLVEVLADGEIHLVGVTVQLFQGLQIDRVRRELFEGLADAHFGLASVRAEVVVEGGQTALTLVDDGLGHEVVEDILGGVAEVEDHVAVLVARARVEVRDLHCRHAAQHVVETRSQEPFRVEGSLDDVVRAVHLPRGVHQWHIGRQDLVESVADRHFLRSRDGLAVDESRPERE